MLERGQKTVLITRMSAKSSRAYPQSMTLTTGSMQGSNSRRDPGAGRVGTVVVATGGTTDIPVAEEAAVTAEILGNKVTRLYDVSVSGVHRLLSHMPEIIDGACYRRRCRNGGARCRRLSADLQIAR